jgi:hypothetical protein
MATQKFMGAGQLIDRLTAQVGSRDTAMSIGSPDFRVDSFIARYSLKTD